MNSVLNLDGQAPSALDGGGDLTPASSAEDQWKSEFCRHYIRCFLKDSDWSLAEVRTLAEREYGNLSVKARTGNPVWAANKALKVWWDDEQ